MHVLHLVQHGFDLPILHHLSHGSQAGSVRLDKDQVIRGAQPQSGGRLAANRVEGDRQSAAQSTVSIVGA